MVKVKVDDLRLAGLRIFNEERNAVEPGDNLSYAILVKKGDVYFNPFDLSENYPVLKRVPYSNTTLDGEDYGTMVSLVYGDINTGPCYILVNLNFKDIFKDDVVSLEEVGKYIINSRKHFKDKENILPYFENENKKKNKFSIFNKHDKSNNKNIDSFFEEEGVSLKKHI